MNISITLELYEALGAKAMKAYGISEEKQRWRSIGLNLREFSNDQVKKLGSLIEPHAKNNVPGARAAFRDISVWQEAAKLGTAKVKCRNTKHFEALAYEYLQKQPKHWLYKKDKERDVWCAYYVGMIVFIEKQKDRHHVTPAHTIIHLYFMELGVRDSVKITFEDHDVAGLTVPEALAAEGYVVETPDLLAEYTANVERYVAVHDKIGKQFYATGVGTTNLDGNERGSDRWRSYGFDTIQMVKSGERSAPRKSARSPSTWTPLRS